MNLLIELQKHYPTNKIEIKERFIKDIRTVDDPEFKKDKDNPNIEPPQIKQDNSLHTYNVVFDEVETDAQMYYNVHYTNEDDYDLMNNVGKSSVAMMIRKLDEWIDNLEEEDLH